jgi:hypothetical protein
MGRILAIAIWLITVLSLWMFLSHRWWFPEAISEHGPSVDRQFVITIIVCGIAFAAAQIGLGWAVWKYRDSADKQRATYSHGNNRLEVVWTVVTASRLYQSGRDGAESLGVAALARRADGSYQIEVTAQQFAWNMRYPGKNNAFGKTDVQYIDDTTNPVGSWTPMLTARTMWFRPTLVVPWIVRGTRPEIKRRDAQLLGAATSLQTGLVPGCRFPFTSPSKVGKYELACARVVRHEPLQDEVVHARAAAERFRRARATCSGGLSNKEEPIAR